MDVMTNILVIVLAVLLYVSVVFMIAWRLKRIDAVDIAWGGAFIVVAIVSFVLGGQKGILQIVTTALIIIWGLRLGLYIYKRFVKSAREDARYAEMRKRWKGNAALNAYLRIFVVQGVLATVIASSVIVINLAQTSSINSIALSVGVLVWLTGFLFESIGDAQLKHHLANPDNQGRLMTSGLWRYSRHPNYFGEVTQWWGVFVIALAVPFGWVSVVSPLTITVLLLFVSGVPMTEKQFEGRTGWQEYKRKTSAFLPLPPKKS